MRYDSPTRIEGKVERQVLRKDCGYPRLEEAERSGVGDDLRCNLHHRNVRDEIEERVNRWNTLGPDFPERMADDDDEVPCCCPDGCCGLLGWGERRDGSRAARVEAARGRYRGSLDLESSRQPLMALHSPFACTKEWMERAASRNILELGRADVTGR